MAATNGDVLRPLDRRDADALRRCMTVLDDVGRARGAPGLYRVVSDSGVSYLVDYREGRCECPDQFYRGGQCVHLKRIAFASGDRVIPAWVDPSGVDGQLAGQLDSEPVWEADNA